jgi:predicted metal-dependent enzyme (double-stranded beta helix superfamily)
LTSHALTKPHLHTQLRTVVDGILAERAQWLPTVQFDAAQRWYRRVDTSHLGDALDVEAWILSWLPGQGTGLHDHGGASGAFAVVTGTLHEHSARTGLSGPPRLLTSSRTSGQLRTFGSHHLHDVVNVGNEPAVSVHVYSPTITTMTRYRWTRRGAVVTAVERAGADW